MLLKIMIGVDMKIITVIFLKTIDNCEKIVYNVKKGGV